MFRCVPFIFLVFNFESAFCCTEESIKSVIPTAEDRDYLLYFHNNLRSKIVDGTYKEVPRAENLNPLVWDDYMARILAIIIQNCEGLLATGPDRDKFFFGNNTGYVLSLFDDTSVKTWKEAMPKWIEQEMVNYDEKPQYHSEKYHGLVRQRGSPLVQIIWDSNERFACGYGAFGSVPKAFYCMYAPGAFPEDVKSRHPYKVATS